MADDQMANDHDQQLARALGEYLASELDGHVGRSEQHFAHLPPGAGVPVRRRRARLARVALGTAAVAASILLWVVLVRPEPAAGTRKDHQPPPAVVQVDKPPKSAEAPPAPKQMRIELAAATARPVLVEQLVRWRTLDEGMVFLDERTPVRKLRRQWLARVAWFDAERGARLEMIVPREEVVFVGINTH